MLLEVKLWNKTVGGLLYDQKNNKIIFQYDNKFVDNGLDISPILMPLKKNTEFVFSNLEKETFKGLPPVFADSLPDKFGSSVLNLWLQSQGKTINDLNALEKLSYVGIRGMGALEYFPSKSFNNRVSDIDISEIVKIASEVLNQKKNKTANFNSINSILQIGTSAGGARAKAIIAINEKTNKILSGDILLDDKDYKYYLMKIDGITDDQLSIPQGYGKIEFAYYKMAKLAKINMMPTRLYEENGRSHFLTERFDRVNGKKLHMQTLCSIANMDYNNQFINSYEQNFRIMDRLNLDYSDIEQQYRRMVFNVIGRNLDDHTKNISFLMDQSGNWKLSPAYDITFAYDDTNQWLRQHQMSINGKRNDITYSDLFNVGKYLGIRNRKIIIKEVIDAISNWSKIAKEVGIIKEHIQKIENLLLYKSFDKN